MHVGTNRTAHDSSRAANELQLRTEAAVVGTAQTADLLQAPAKSRPQIDVQSQSRAMLSQQQAEQPVTPTGGKAKSVSWASMPDYDATDSCVEQQRHSKDHISLLSTADDSIQANLIPSTANNNTQDSLRSRSLHASAATWADAASVSQGCPDNLSSSPRQGLESLRFTIAHQTATTSQCAAGQGHLASGQGHFPARQGRPAAGQGQMQAAEALSALAEGQMQCSVTGKAFEVLLQLHDLAPLETVMQSSVVFSRMQPHQKGQVMDLLGQRGNHQLFDVQHCYVAVHLLLHIALLHSIDTSQNASLLGM